MFKNNSQSISLNDIFFGSEQSRYAGIALFGTIFVLCIAILFSSSKIPIDQRLAFVLFILIASAPSVLMTLFELTCIVTGGNSTTRWWCWLLAWVIAVIIIIYCILVVISLISSMAGYDVANQRAVIKEDEKKNENVADLELANDYANKMLKDDEEIKNPPKKVAPPVAKKVAPPQAPPQAPPTQMPQLMPQRVPQQVPQQMPQEHSDNIMGFDAASSGYASL